ncbi:unnamed protein product [Colias eurytheme]|nr:unnamed protein product [Colias eurytheme]
MASLDILTPHLDKIKIPTSQQLVYKDECVYSFDNPESETGLYVSLTSFLGFGRNYVEQYFQKTGNAVFLHITREKKPIPEPEQTGDGPEKKITRLAIGVEGGFDPDCGKPKYTYTDHYNVVVLPGFQSYPWPNDALPEVIKKSVQGILDAESPFKIAEMQALHGTWDGEKREVSVHAVNLLQLDNGIKIPPSGWKCEKCDLTNNLWLNLTDGSILCGRRFFDGSGGNDHAVEHYRQTGYPLAVKLGTITAEGKGDVFSYAEDDMVEDPFLADHLKHFGINVQQLQKTEKSMAELELELNRRTGEWNTLQESGSELRPLHGPALTGLNNLGNSCYINSVLQVMFRMPDFVRRFVEGAPEIFATFPEDPVNDFNVQTAKVGVGLISGRYSFPGEVDGSQQGISPHMYRQLIGKGHPEFMTKRQQDAHEFFLHFLTLLERNSRHRVNPSECMRFAVEERVQCTESRGVRYTRRAEHHLPLPVPVAAADNVQQLREYEKRRANAEASGQRLDPSEVVRPHIPFQACLESFMKEETVEQFFSSAVNKKVTAKKITRLATFPDYLLIQLKKFTIKEDWTPAKLDVAVDMPWEVDLSCLRGSGLQADETLLPETANETPAPVFDDNLLSQLLDMGFPVEACKKSLYYTNNSSMEAASNWLMEHMTDWDFANKFEPPGSRASDDASVDVDPASVEQITSMGFTNTQAAKALRATGGDVARALDWIFSRADQLDEQPGAVDNERSLGCRDGQEKYKLVAFISHMGTSTMVGHYVCHILHEGRWVIFNDNKVALSENPPKDLGYLYLYERL